MIDRETFQQLWKRGIHKPNKPLGFGAMTTEWIPCFMESGGTPIEKQRMFILDGPNPDDYGGYTAAFLKAERYFLYTARYKKVGLPAEAQLWGTELGWKLMSPTLGCTTKFFDYTAIKFHKVIPLGDDMLAGLICRYSVDARQTIHDGKIPDTSEIAHQFVSKVPAYDLTGRQFEWTNMGIVLF